MPVLITATDLDGDSGEHISGDCDLGFTVAISPANGTLSPIVNSTCTSNAPNTDNVPNEDAASIAYTPDGAFSGTDMFSILICDDDTCVTATITVNIGLASATPTPSGSPGPTGTPTPVPSETPVPTQLPFEFGDLDCDNDVDAIDALSILLWLAGFPPIVSDDPNCPSLGDGGPTATPAPTATPTPVP